VQLTLVGMRTDIVPIPVKGSDDAFHVVYEIEVTNFTGERVRLERLDVLDARRDRVAATLGSGSTSRGASTSATRAARRAT
jgi:hypothetical protein